MRSSSWRTCYAARAAARCVLRALSCSKRAAAHGSPAKSDSPVTLVFSGSGLLLSYYAGVFQYIYDNFDLLGVRVCGISGGTTAALTLAFQAPAARVLELGMRVREMMMSRWLLCYLMGHGEMGEVLVREMRLMGISDKHAARVSAEGHVKYGVTTFDGRGGLAPQHRLVGLAGTIRDGIFQMLSSMCILPFFRCPGDIGIGRWAFDGGFSALYPMPADADPDRTVRVCPFPFVPADVQPESFSRMHFVDVVCPTSVARQVELFRQGYEMASRHRSSFLAKGMVPLVQLRGTLRSHLAEIEDTAILRSRSRPRRSKSVIAATRRSLPQQPGFSRRSSSHGADASLRAPLDKCFSTSRVYNGRIRAFAAFAALEQGMGLW
mmetsp:Transcript_31794/g.69563  ORF Transcript_31794/g.69563 Transcript_31794/m.69563 type:complete len:379 (+) Transcript_31794:12-1148(+)|eukprot:CAMPEP_0204478788 /NCGR_PEP_ID=MMETSP0471-20130131/33708_1 /ASSEMBLY_ACC=CAM_ASM_000602 /TAXON_ID=2969 /ORGANISM="Oxyrrhis marina" /LENGTH=378 /DNA_ID=CAMNT_0051481657 /DNA_START=12 /DNA_END=1148 /DNA_ORIENTATION=+